MIPYTRQYIDESDVQAVADACQTSMITRGPLVRAFESQCADYCGAKYGVAFNSGSNALSAAFYAAQLSKDDLVITSPNTFVGTVAGALKQTNQLQFLDIELHTGGINQEDITLPKSKRTFIVPVHYSGIAQKPYKPNSGTIIIEDACEAFGSKYADNTRVGNCLTSDMCVFSFHPAKTICMGEGGLVTTNHRSYYERLLLYRNNGIVKKATFEPGYYEICDLTTNCNVTEMQAALGLSQLKKIDWMLKERRKIAQKYHNCLSKFDFITFLDSASLQLSAHNLFPILIDFTDLKISKEMLMKRLAQNEIGTQVHFIPLYKHPFFSQKFAFDECDFVCMEHFYQRELSLPLYVGLKEMEIEKICEQLIEILLEKTALSTS